MQMVRIHPKIIRFKKQKTQEYPEIEDPKVIWGVGATPDTKCESDGKKIMIFMAWSLLFDWIVYIEIWIWYISKGYKQAGTPAVISWF